MLTPGNTAWVASSIVPLTVALLIWPNIAVAEKAISRMLAARIDLPIIPPFKLREIMVGAWCGVKEISIQTIRYQPDPANLESVPVAINPFVRWKPKQNLLYTL